MTAGPWRYVAQHPITQELIDLELPLRDVVLTRRLSGPWGMAAKVKPETGRLLGADGNRLLDEWAVQVWADRDRTIRGGGILTGSQIVGAEWALTFEGHARYPYGIPYDSAFSRIQVDPLECFRHVWDHVQSYPDGNLRVVVDTTTTGGAVKLGTPEVPAYTEVSFSAEGTPKEQQVWVREDSVPASRVYRPVKTKVAQYATRLSAAIGENVTTLDVTTDEFKGKPTPFTVKIGSERIRVRALSANGRTMSNLIRGYQPDNGTSKTNDRATHDKNDPVEYDGMGKVDEQVFLPPANQWAAARPYDDTFADVPTPFTIKIGSELIRVREKAGGVLSRLIRGWDPVAKAAKPGQIDPHAGGSEVSYDGTPRRKIERVPAVPYALAWWDAVDCGDELETLAKETPFEFVEGHAWSGDTIAHRIRLGYPRVGRRLVDVVFVEGENLATVPTVERDGDVFAQYVIGLGAGEGRKRRRTATIGSPDGRLRRPHLLERSDVTSQDRLNRLAQAEQQARRNMSAIPEVILTDHPNAPLGSFDLGDEVLVELGYGWARESVWCRIVEETVTPAADGRAVALKLTRADGL